MISYAIERLQSQEQRVGFYYERRDLKNATFFEVEVYLYWWTLFMTLTKQLGSIRNGKVNPSGEFLSSLKDPDH